MRCQAEAAPTATIPSSMPPSAPLVKPPRSGLLSYIPTSISSILPARGCVDASSPPPSAPPAPPSPSKMSPPSGTTTTTKGSAEAAELSRVFQLLDRNGDGRITREELEDCLGKLGIPVPGDELAAMIARIDADGDGCVDEEEFGELYRAIMSTGGGEDEEKKGGDEGVEEDEDMREAFRVFDANGDGYITVEELGAVLASLGLKQGRTAEECRRMIGQVDRDGDGRVDFHEFLQMMRGGGFAALG